MTQFDEHTLKKIEQRARQLCKKWGCPKQDQADVIQEVFLLTLQDGRKVESAVTQAMRNVCRDPALPVPNLADETTPAQLAEEREEQELILERLAPRDQGVAPMLEGGHTMAEIAKKTGVSYHEVDQHLRNVAQRAKNGSRLGPPYERKNVNYKADSGGKKLS